MIQKLANKEARLSRLSQSPEITKIKDDIGYVSQIPKHIHQIWLQGESELPERYVPFRKTIQEKHPHWKITLWDDKMMIDFLKQNDDLIPGYSMSKVYQDFEYLHQKVDFFRYVLLYVEGGVYIDMDCESLKCLDSILEEYSSYDVIVSRLNLYEWESYLFSQKPDVLNNGVILAKPNSEPMLHLIKQVVNSCNCVDMTLLSYFTKPACFPWIQKTKMLTIYFTTGPTSFTKALYPFVQDKVKVLSSEYFEPCEISNNCTITENTYVYHQKDSSWLPLPIYYVISFYYKHRFIILLFLFVSAILLYLIFIMK